MAFLHLARSDARYVEKGLSNERSLIGQTIEWFGYNAVSYFAIAGSVILGLIHNTDLEELLWQLFYNHTKDVDLENRQDWWKFWEHF